MVWFCSESEVTLSNMTKSLLKLVTCFIGNVLCNTNFTNGDYNITLFDDQNVTVSYHGPWFKTLEILHLRSLILIICKTENFKVIVNSTEWEMILEFHEFDQPWMRYALGKDSHQTNQIYVI